MRRFKVTDLLIGIIFTLLFVSIAVVFTINFRPLYYADIKFLNIEASSGINKSEIINNYDALIDYSSPFFRGDLIFPTLSASESGLQHFIEVKKIFSFFYIIGAVTLVIGITIILWKAKKKDYSYLMVSAVTGIVLPLLLSAYMVIDFDRAFLLFHKLFFKNDYWIFDPITDPVINILPEQFFMHCAVLIVVIVLLFCFSFFGVFFWKKSRLSIRYRKNKGLKL